MDGSRLCLDVLGELTARSDGTPLDLGGRRQRAVLARLVVARGEVVPAGRLVDDVWGDDPPANAPGALQSYVSHLRRRLEPGASARARSGVIVSTGPGYAVRVPGDAVDAWRFERLVRESAEQPPEQARPGLEAALQLWRGPAYAEYVGEPWAEAEAARLTERREVARERLAEVRLAGGESALLVPELEALVAEQPLREQRWRLLVLALYRAQRQADALSALRRARDTLADELGVDPGPALRALEAEVLAQSPALDVPAQRGAPGSAAAPPASGAVATAPPAARPPDLVDRDRELEAVHRAVDDVLAGAPGLLLIEGPAGIGKTRLLSEACRVAAGGGLTVLSARGTPLERSFGFGAARQLFEPYLADPERRAAALAGAASSARGVFEQVDGQHRADGSFSVLHGLYWLTANLAARGPLVLGIDDLHWCDTSSLRFLAYLAKRLEALPVLVVATLRTGERHEDEALLTELALEPGTSPLRPGPLSLAATAELVEARLGPPAPSFLAACHRTTGGNPLLLRQLLRALESEGVRPDVAHTDTVRAVGSRAVSSLVLLRLRRVPRDALCAARAVAVLGEGAELPWVAALAELDELKTARVLAALSRAEVLRDDEHLAFVHPLVRDAVYGDLPAAERALQHERAAAVLQEHGAAPEQVAAHLLLAPRRGRSASVAVLRAAARTAADRGASDSAVTLLRRALEEPAGAARAEVLVELGLTQSLLDGPAGVAHLREAYELVRDPAVRGPLALAIARTQVFAGERGAATRSARAALADLPPDLRDLRQGLLAVQRASGLMHGLDPAEYRPGGAPEVEGTGDGARLHAAVLAHELLLTGEQRHRVTELARFAMAGDHLLQRDPGLFWVMAAVARMVADDDLGDLWERARARAHATGSLFSMLSTNIWRGFAEWRRGELPEALHSLSEGVEQVRMWGDRRVAAPYATAFLIGIHLDLGQVAAARAVADEDGRELSVGEGARLLSYANTRLLLAERRPREALVELARAEDPYGIVNPAWAPWRSLRARALHALGRRAEALTLVEEEVRLLRRWGAPTWLAPSLRLLGELLGPAGAPALREAEALLAPSSAVLECARARLAIGRSRSVPDAEAVPLLEQAVEAARTCGAAGVLQSAVRALEQRGRSVDARLCQVQISRTERQALDLSAEGLTVPEVAQRLFLTPGTVLRWLETASSRTAS